MFIHTNWYTPNKFGQNMLVCSHIHIPESLGQTKHPGHRLPWSGQEYIEERLRPQPDKVFFWPRLL
jgi:hypothetical protein